MLVNLEAVIGPHEKGQRQETTIKASKTHWDGQSGEVNCGEEYLPQIVFMRTSLETAAWIVAGLLYWVSERGWLASILEEAGSPLLALPAED